MSEITLNVEDVSLLDLYGEQNVKLNIIRKAYPDVTVTSRGNQLKLKGDDKSEVQQVKSKLETMVRILREKKELSTQAVEDISRGGNLVENRLSSGSDNITIVYGKDGVPIKAKTRNQKRLVEAIEANDIVFAVGPAGTGKTYTAMAMAVRALKNRLVKKIILTRPAVEAGESLGFLPGDLKEKVDPYLRPLYDALDDMFPADKLAQFMLNRVIEVAPLAFMRGRTLNDAFIILDEAQNSTTMQMKMFLTRIGPNSRAVITGDLTQIDLPYHVKSGLRQSLDILQHVPGIVQVHLSAEDVVRHRLVKEIILAYDKNEERQRQQRKLDDDKAKGIIYTEEEKKIILEPSVKNVEVVGETENGVTETHL